MSQRNADWTFSRRETLRLAGLGIATTLLPSFATGLLAAPGDAAAPAAGASNQQGAGFYRFKLGALECAMISDGGFPGRPTDLFPKVGDDEMAEALDKAYVAPGFLPMTVNGMLVRSGSNVILIDTGTGGGMGASAGKFTANLANLGVQPDEVTHVILSHGHGDHIGGLLTPDGSSRFSKAKLYISEAEHAFWTGASPKFPDNTLLPAQFQQSMIGGAQKVLGAVKSQLELKKPGDVIADVCTLVDVAGHTPGMVAVKIGSGADDSVLYVADTINVIQLQAAHPEWKILYDTDPDVGAKTRKRVFEDAATDRTLIVGPHLPFPAIGHVAKDGNAYRWVPRTWEW